MFLEASQLGRWRWGPLGSFHTGAASKKIVQTPNVSAVCDLKFSRSPIKKEPHKKRSKKQVKLVLFTQYIQNIHSVCDQNKNNH